MLNQTVDKSKIEDGRPLLLNAGGIEIGIFKIKGVYLAIRNRCPHQGGPVCTGRITGTLAMGPETNWKLKWCKDKEILVCPWHGLEFDIRSGQCIATQSYGLDKYSVKVIGDKIVVRG